MPTPKDCGFNESCCGRQSNLPGKCTKSCIGKSCKDNNQCGKGEYCCTSEGKCKSNCIGQLCTSPITTVRKAELVVVGIPSHP